MHPKGKNQIAVQSTETDQSKYQSINVILGLFVPKVSTIADANN